MLYYDSIKSIFKEEKKMNVKDLLAKRIEKLNESMEKMEPGSDEYKAAADVLAKLLDKLNDIEKTDYEYWDKQESRNKETELKLKQMREDRVDHIVKNCLTAVSVIGGLTLTVWGTLVSLDFEKTGSVTTIMGRGFINNLLPKKHN